MDGLGVFRGTFSIDFLKGLAEIEGILESNQGGDLLDGTSGILNEGLRSFHSHLGDIFSRGCIKILFR